MKNNELSKMHFFTLTIQKPSINDFYAQNYDIIVKRGIYLPDRRRSIASTFPILYRLIFSYKSK